MDKCDAAEAMDPHTSYGNDVHKGSPSVPGVDKKLVSNIADVMPEYQNCLPEEELQGL